MTHAYRPHHALMARLIADAILNGQLQQNPTTEGVFARPEVLTAHFTWTAIQRATGWRHFGGGGTDSGNPVRRPLFLDFDDPDGEGYRLEGIGLTPAAVEWLVTQRYLPAKFVAVFGHVYDVSSDDIWDDPLFQTWLSNFWIKPTAEGFQYPKPKASSPPRVVTATTTTAVVDRLMYSAAERAEAFARIDALPISRGSKAAHKAHVSRRTVAA